MERNHKAFIKGISLIFLSGKCFGVVPLNVLQEWKHGKRQINKMANIITIGFTLLLLVDTSFRIHHILKNFQRSLPLDKLAGLDEILYFGSMLYVYIYQLFTQKRFHQVINEFMDSSTPVSSKFPRYCRIIILTALFLGLVEEALYFQMTIKPMRHPNNTNLLEIYYEENMPYWKCIDFMYNIPVAITMGVFIASATLGWISTDVICVVLFRALWEKLHALENKIKLESKGQTGWKSGNSSWHDIRIQYIEITNLCQTVQQYTFPLIVACYVGLVNEITVNLFLWIGPTKSIGGVAYKFLEAGFPFLHYCFRVAALTYFAANVHHKSLEIFKIIARLPKSAYTTDVERLERTVANYPTGIKLFESILITRRAFIAIISVIITIEIFLLQTFLRIA